MNLFVMKFISIICFCLLIVAILVAYYHPAANYELDIYASTPMMVWLSVYVCLLAGAGIIIYQIITKGYKLNKSWLLGFSIIILARAVLLYAPYIRGYVGWHGDSIRYLGMIKDILSTGHFAESNFYPITHIFLSETTVVSDIPDILVANLSTTLISILFIFFIYLLAGAITNDKGKQLLSTLIAGIVMLTAGYNVILAPNGWSILFIPLLFYLYFKSHNRNYRVAFVFVLVIYPFFHPLSSLMVIISLSIMELIRRILPHFLKNRISGFPSNPPKILVTYVVIEFMAFSSWILAHQGFNANITLMWQQITSGLGSDKIAELSASVDKINIHGLDLYILLFKLFGADIILIVISVIGILSLLARVRSNHFEYYLRIFPISCVFVICGLFYAAYLLGLPGIAALGTGQWDRRLLGYADILLPLLPVIVFFASSSLRFSFRLVQGSIIVLILSASILSLASLFPSPYIKQPNLQTTAAEIIGTRWFMEEKNADIDTIFIMSPPSEIASGIIGYNLARVRTDLGIESGQIDDHLGYLQLNSLGSKYLGDKYLCITKYDRTVYSTVWKAVGRFNDADFARLEEDPTVIKLYSNNYNEFYYVYSLSSS